MKTCKSKNTYKNKKNLQKAIKFPKIFFIFVGLLIIKN